MATVYKKMYPIPMPDGAEISTRHGKKVAKWESGKGQVRTAEVLDGNRVMFVSDCWYVRYRDADGVMRRETTGCRDKQAAEKFLADLLARVDKVKGGVMSVEELSVGDHAVEPINKHVEDYLAQLAVKTVRGRRVSPQHVENVRRQLERVVRECRFKRLKDITRQAVQRWMNQLVSQPRDDRYGNGGDAESEPLDPLAARTINMHRAAIVAFCGWCDSVGRLPGHPLASLPKVEETDPARKRRPLSEAEIARLLKVVQERPLLEALTIRTGKNKGKPLANVRDEVRKQLKEAGRVRALIYKFMILTGLRRKETASLTVGSLCLDVDNPYVKVVVKHAKGAKEAALPLRSDLADALREHIACMANGGSGNGSDNPLPPGCCTTAQVSPTTPLFRIDWPNLLRTYNLDLAAAGITKKDDQGRTVDVHGLRHTFATLLARKGVLPATAQKLMRHSDIRLTMNVYTHLEIADTASAVAALPTL